MEPTKLLRSWPAGNCFKLCWDTSQFETWEISELTSITILIYFFFLISILTSVKKCSLIKLNVKYILKIFFTFVLSSWEEEDTSDFLPGFILMTKMALCVIPGILFKHTYFSLHVNSNLQKDKYCPWLKNHIKEKKKKILWKREISLQSALRTILWYESGITRLHLEMETLLSGSLHALRRVCWPQRAPDFPAVSGTDLDYSRSAATAAWKRRSWGISQAGVSFIPWKSRSV